MPCPRARLAPPSLGRLPVWTLQPAGTHRGDELMPVLTLRPRGRSRTALSRVRAESRGEPAISADGHTGGHDDGFDGKRGVDVWERLLAAVQGLDSHLGPQATGVDLEEDDVASAAVDEIGDGLHLVRERTVDAALVLERPAERRPPIGRSAVSRLLPLIP